MKYKYLVGFISELPWGIRRFGSSEIESYNKLSYNDLMEELKKEYYVKYTADIKYRDKDILELTPLSISLLNDILRIEDE